MSVELINTLAPTVLSILAAILIPLGGYLDKRLMERLPSNEGVLLKEIPSGVVLTVRQQFGGNANEWKKDTTAEPTTKIASQQLGKRFTKEEISVLVEGAVAAMKAAGSPSIPYSVPSAQ